MREREKEGEGKRERERESIEERRGEIVEKEECEYRRIDLLSRSISLASLASR